MLSRHIRLNIVKTIQKLTIQSIENYLKENMDKNKNFSDIYLTDYCRMHTLIYRVNEFFTTTLDECDLDVKIYDNIKNRNEDISFYELN